MCLQVWTKEIRETTEDVHVRKGLLKSGQETSSAQTQHISDSIKDFELDRLFV